MRYLTILIIITSLNAQGQPVVIKGHIKNFEGENLPFTSISFTNKFGGVVADENGAFEIIISKEDTLKFSNIGYLDTIISYKEIKNVSIIKLQPKVAILETVNVSSIDINKFREEDKSGIEVKKSKSFFKSKPGFCIVVKMDNKFHKIGVIKNIRIAVSKKQFNKPQIRLRIFSINQITGLPKDDLLLDNIVLTVGKPHPLINLEQYKILFPIEGCFVGFEWLNEAEKISSRYTEGLVEPILELTEEVKEIKTYVRNFNNNWSAWKFSPISQRGPQNALIQITFKHN